jgi:hypothetical protein
MFSLFRSKCGLSFGTASLLSYNNRFFSNINTSDCEETSNNSKKSSREVSLKGRVVLITGATAGIGIGK